MLVIVWKFSWIWDCKFVIPIGNVYANPSKICKENIFLFVQKISYHCLHVPLYKEIIIYSWMNVYEGYSFLPGRHCLIKCCHLLNSHKIQNPTCFVPSLAFVLYMFFGCFENKKVMKQNKLTNICKKYILHVYSFSDLLIFF